MIKRNKKSLLSDKIADILRTTPGHVDPEDDIYEETTARVTTQDSEEEESEVNLSKFRKQNVDLLEDVDNKYAGKKSSRKSLQDSDEDWETEDEGLSTDEGEALDGIPGTQEFAEEEESDVEQESDAADEASTEEESEDSDNEDDYDINSVEGNEHESDFKHLSASSLPEQKRKGQCVRNQLNIWENLLEIRIQLQKCLLTANKLPQHDTFGDLNNEASFKNAVSTTKKNVSRMLDKFLSLQTLLIKQYGETKNLFKDKKKKDLEEKNESDEEIPSDTEDESKSDEDESEEEVVPRKRKKLSDFEEEINVQHNKYTDYRNSVIQKWNDKTRLALGKNNKVSNTIIQQIEYLLGDKQKLLRRTQLKKSEFEVLGKKKENVQENNTKTEDYDTEIYDDTDFYHQLLRELIEVKSVDVTDPVQMSRQWIALQNLRSKMKRKIDTKATKGRKIRYAVHSKLVNFMAPITDETWTDEAKNELYCSLFGNKQVVT